jgi:ABC-type uncharacterized transport system substrate-binding protein
MKRLVASVVLAAAFASTAGLAKAQDVKIAVVGSINRATGDQMKRGAEMAVKDINAKGGVLGKRLDLIVADDACDPKQAIAAANDVVGKGVVFVAGHNCSSASIPASEVYNEAGVLQMTPASTSTALTDDAAQKGWNNVFRTCGRDDAQGAFAGKYLAYHYKGKRVAIVHDETAYGKGIADETMKAMNTAGLKQTIYEAVTQGDKDFSALISKMKDENIDVIYYGGYQTEAGLIVRQARDPRIEGAVHRRRCAVYRGILEDRRPGGRRHVDNLPARPAQRARRVGRRRQIQGRRLRSQRPHALHLRHDPGLRASGREGQIGQRRRSVEGAAFDDCAHGRRPVDLGREGRRHRLEIRLLRVEERYLRRDVVHSPAEWREIGRPVSAEIEWTPDIARVTRSNSTPR